MNRESVRSIQKSIFTLCLDAPMPRVSDDVYRSHVAGQMLHGGGGKLNSGNRWFDKTLQVRARRGWDSLPCTHTQAWPTAAPGLPAPRLGVPGLPARKAGGKPAGGCGCNYWKVSLSLLGLAQKLLSPLQHIRGSLGCGAWQSGVVLAVTFLLCTFKTTPGEGTAGTQ